MPTKTIAWTTGTGNITLTYTGQGDGTITVSSDDNTGAARSQTIVIETTAGTPVVTKNVTINQAAAAPAIQNFAYTGSVQSCTLPAGTYRLQCWGAQGGSNAADADYGITSQAGGKGGYSEGILTLTSPTTLYIFVGGQGGASGNGGWNCGGGSTGSTTRTSGNDTYLAKMGCGGGATDFALVTSSMTYSSRRNNRSSASLLSRIIVAGGGSGGAMGCTRTTTVARTVNGTDLTEKVGFIIKSTGKWSTSNNYRYDIIDVTANRGHTFTVNVGTADKCGYSFLTAAPPTTNNANVSYATGYSTAVYTDENPNTGTVPSNAVYMWVGITGTNINYRPSSITFETTTDSLVSQQGYAGGGVNGDGYVESTYDYRGRQDGAGALADFGFGANQNNSSSAYCSAAGGAGWYGGGSNNSNTSRSRIRTTGGGSGFVNIAANAQYRPDGYTGLQLSQGVTIDGNQSFESTSGGSETGHEGNGYARISNLYAPEALLKVPLSFDILTSGTVVWKASNSSLTKTIQYRKNYGEWTSITSTTGGVSISVSAGDLLQFRGDNTAYGNSSYYNSFGGTADFNVWGNIMSLINSTSYATLTTLSSSYTFRALFTGNNHLLDAARLQLPATTLATYCYYSFFYNCKYLVKGVKILPATTLANHCYRSMYSGCSSLERGSDILASSLVSYSLYYMHSNCTSLKYIKCLATSGINSSSSTTNFTNNVPAGGVFVKTSSASWPTGVNGIPSGWDIIEV